MKVKYKILKIESINYNSAYHLQQILQNKVIDNSEEQYILFLSHPHVITAGKRGFSDNLKYPLTFYKERNITLFQSDRGGFSTYHGPGQLVVYFLISLNNLNLGIKKFVNIIENSIIDCLKEFSIKSYHHPEYRGVFTGDNKICSLGFQVKKGVTKHGLALNINSDLSYFDTIIPCGIVDKGITSMKKELGNKVDFNSVVDRLIVSLEKNLEIKFEIG